MNDLMEIILRLVLEIFFEALLKLPGYLLLSVFGNSKPTDPDGCLVIAIGVVSWVSIGGMLCWWLW